MEVPSAPEPMMLDAAPPLAAPAPAGSDTVTPAVQIWAGPTVVSPELMRSVWEHQRQFTQALLDKAKAICAEHGVDAETLIEVGDAKEAICEAAEKLNVDLLILESHRRGPI